MNAKTLHEACTMFPGPGRRSWFFPVLFLLGALPAARGGGAEPASSVDPDLRWAGFRRQRPAWITAPVVASDAEFTQADQIMDLAAPTAAGPVVTSAEPPFASACAGGACAVGPCTPYYRDRPLGKKKQQQETMLRNRLGEPSWYRYYRCEHFGYHPTQWMPWPEGWMTCRRPLPGAHPYDLKQPIPKNSTGARPESGPSPMQPEPRRTTPERLPEPGSLPPPPVTPPAPAPGAT